MGGNGGGSAAGLSEKGLEKIMIYTYKKYRYYAETCFNHMAPERGGNAKVGAQYPVAVKAYELNKNKPKEVCNTMQPHLPGIDGGSTWGYNKSIDGHHLKVDDVKKLLDDARLNHYNLLLNIGPMPDGSVHPEDIETVSTLQKN
jgi:alpha-L-fucosidase